MQARSVRKEGERLAIVALVSSMDAGGAERAVANLTKAWSERGDDVILVATFSGRSGCAYQLHERVRLVRLADLAQMHANGLRSRVRRVLALRTLLRSLRPDVVVSFLTNVNVATLLATRGLGLPVFVNEQIHPPHTELTPVWQALRRLSYPLADRVVMLTPEGCEWLARKIPSALCSVIPNPVERPPLGLLRALQPDELVPGSRKLLLAAGRLVDQKGFDLLVSAFHRVSETCRDWSLVILGEGPNRAKLAEQIASLNLAHRVFLPGVVGNIGAWYDAADLYVLSSRFEGFPGVVGEAMAHGLPVVSYDCETGPRHMVRDGVDGILVSPVGSVDALTSALARLMLDEAERRKMAARAADILGRYSVTQILEMWDDAFNTIPYAEGHP